MKNAYIKLFERMSRQKPGELINISKFEDLGFFLTDFERLHDERYVFLERHNEIKDSKTKVRIVAHYVKLAPRGFTSLEEYGKIQRQDKINSEVLRATIIIAVATALNVLITLFVFLLNLEQFHWSRPIALAIIGVAIAGLSGKLFKELYNLLFRRKKNVGSNI